jgi:hypothetical protein
VEGGLSDLSKGTLWLSLNWSTKQAPVSDERLEEIAEAQEYGLAHFATLEARDLYSIVAELRAFRSQRRSQGDPRK